ncbi:serine protease inhibitor Cvsi-2-like [Ruditapes philippinarum]|uniref:serine protease inhibitor Cvsi-2-like n=1 Tax=Ruditapes philippinarum TaxID=129788 RepID=UPI00295C224B|nr:serine protease inhibitor Cvsi-2-like [Ruditapes philippinarum]
MKIALLCTVFVAVFAFIGAEQCSSNSACHHVTCPENDYNVECHLFSCTCTHVAQTCSDASDCHDDNCHRSVHCIDGACRCGYGILPSGGGFPGK